MLCRKKIFQQVLNSRLILQVHLNIIRQENEMHPEPNVCLEGVSTIYKAINYRSQFSVHNVERWWIQDFSVVWLV